MTLSVGDCNPNVTLMTMTGEGPAPVGSGEALGSGTGVLFAVPGAFTPTCSDHHLPGYVRRADELPAKEVEHGCLYRGQRCVRAQGLGRLGRGRRQGRHAR